MAPVHTAILADRQGARIAAGPRADFGEDARWMELRGAIGPGSRLELTLDPAETLTLALPAMPLGERELKRMLGRYAPVPVGQLAWSRPFIGPAGEPTVVIARRDTLDRIAGLVEDRLDAVGVQASDRDGHQLRYRSPRKRRRGRVIGAGIAAGLSLSLLVAVSVLPPADDNAPRVMIADRPATLRIDKNVRLAPGPAGSPMPSTTAAVAARPAPFALVGIAGRLPGQAEVLVRAPWGETTVMRVGDRFMGWRLNDVTPDRIIIEAEGQTRELRIPADK